MRLVKIDNTHYLNMNQINYIFIRHDNAVSAVLSCGYQFSLYDAPSFDAAKAWLEDYYTIHQA